MNIKSIKELSDDVKELARAGSVFKINLFKAVSNDENIGFAAKDDYISTAAAIVNKWTTYSDYITDCMKKGNESKASHLNVSYNEIKPYLYSKCDYASVLKFVDGLLKGMEDGFRDNDDIDDYFDDAIDDAFPDREESTAGLLREVNEFDSGTDHEVPLSEIKLFEAIKYQDIFNRRDNKELMAAIREVSDYICKKINIIIDNTIYNPTLCISIINHAVEYMTYSVTAYITRIFAIGYYVEPFASDVVSFKESIEVTDSLELGVMQNANETLFRDVSNFEPVEEFMREWLKRMEITNEISEFKKTDTVFYQKTLANPLREFVDTQLRMLSNQRTVSDYKSMRDKLNEFLHNKNQAIQGQSTPRQEILFVIKNEKPKNETVEGYEELAKDLVHYVTYMMRCLSDSYSNIQRSIIDENNSPSYNNSILVAGEESMKYIGEFYRELGAALLSRAKDIEMAIADIKNEKVRKRMEELTIGIDGSNKSDRSSNDNTMSAIPDTTRISSDISGLYALPTMESLEMYDEFVKDVLGYAGDPYYEAFDVSSIINTIKSLIAGLIRRAREFFTGKAFKGCVDWCNAHKQEMMSANYEGSIEVLPYETNKSINVVDDIVKAINGISADAMKKENATEALDKLMQPIFHEGEVNEKIRSLNDRAIGYIFMGKDSKDNNEVAPFTLETSNPDFKKYLQRWFDVVLNSEKTHKDITNSFNDINKAIDELKKKVTQATGGTTSTQQSATGNTPPDISANDNTNNNQTTTNTNTQTNTQTNTTNNTQTNTNNNQANNGNSSETNIRTNLIKVQKTVTMLYNVIYQGVVKSIKDQYSYIQSAYQIKK